MASASQKSVYVAIAGNLLIAVSKFVGAAKTGSSAMISEGIHSLVDTLDGVLLLIGERRSRQPASDLHPFGYGLELYFWTLIVAILIFALGGGMSIYEGISHLLRPHQIENPEWNYFILAFAAAAEGTSFVVALKTFLKLRRYPGIWQSIRNGKDPTLFTVLFEDSAALVGLLFAFLAVYFGYKLQNPYLDGMASIAIGLTLSIVSFLLARESKDLLTGESVRPGLKEQVQKTVMDHPWVTSMPQTMTMHFGPLSILLILKISFQKNLSVHDVVTATAEIKRTLKEKFPALKFVFIELQA
jgi:cation diffusion facilitator family transporter